MDMGRLAHSSIHPFIIHSSIGFIHSSYYYDLLVLNDGEEFECAAVLLNHLQDVKCVRWNPQEEVRHVIIT